MAEPPFRATIGPMSLYAPVLKLAVTWRATSTPSLVTPVFILDCRGMFAYRDKFFFSPENDFHRPIRFKAKNEVIGSNRSEPFDPNPPPKVSTMTLTLASGRLKISAIWERMA